MASSWVLLTKKGDASASVDFLDPQGTPSEAKLRELFVRQESTSTGSKGLIPRDVFLNTMRDSGVVAASSNQLLGLFGGLDSDQDGALDFDEFVLAAKRAAAVEQTELDIGMVDGFGLTMGQGTSL